MENKSKTTSVTQKRRFEGIVVSDSMQKTRVVEVSNVKRHKTYNKFFKVSKRYKAHDENNEYVKGDKVIIEETRPISKDKRWRIVEKLGHTEIIEKENEVTDNEEKSNEVEA